MNERPESAGRAMVSAAESVLRAGGSIAFDDDPDRAIYAAVDAVGDPAWRQWDRAKISQSLVLSGPRARALGIVAGSEASLTLLLQPADDVEALAGRTAGAVALEGREARLADGYAHAALMLAKAAGLLPAVVERRGSGARPTLRLPTVGVLGAGSGLAALDIDIEVSLPIASAESARLFAFRAASSSAEHLALTIGDFVASEAPLCRLHSECLTGDVFGSLRCDCGDQLQAALELMAVEGAGVLLYLRQEGRGIGLVNKLRAYRLQERGLDTLDANTHLGFGVDERDFAVAATMLARLGISRIRLLTNNPHKVRILGLHGIEIVDRVPLLAVPNRHNHGYLQTKERRAGHLLRALSGARSAALPLGA